MITFLVWHLRVPKTYVPKGNLLWNSISDCFWMLMNEKNLVFSLAGPAKSVGNEAHTLSAL